MGSIQRENAILFFYEKIVPLWKKNKFNMKHKLFSVWAALLMSTILFAQSSEQPLTVYPFNPDANYQLYPTRNRYTFLKLDTRTGEIWHVQWSTEDNEMQYPLCDSPLYESDTTRVAGRFALYPTTNWYNFILLDQKEGTVWQIQWNTERNKRIITKIYKSYGS